jgi:hypothetical protein
VYLGRIDFLVNLAILFVAQKQKMQIKGTAAPDYIGLNGVWYGWIDFQGNRN